MDSSNFRDVLAKHSLYCLGVAHNPAEEDVVRFFNGSKKAHLVQPAGSNENPKWLILFDKPSALQYYLYNQQPLTFEGSVVSLQPCQVPCDIPDEWEEFVQLVKEGEASEANKHFGYGNVPAYPPYPGQPAGFQGQPAGYPRQPGGYPGQPSGYPGQQGGMPGQQGSGPGQPGGGPGQQGGIQEQQGGGPGQQGGIPGQQGGGPEQPKQEGFSQGGQGVPGGQQAAPGGPGPGIPGQYAPYPYQWPPYPGYFGGQPAGPGKNQPGAAQGMPQHGHPKGAPPMPQYMPPPGYPYPMWNPYGPYGQPPPPYRKGKEPGSDVGKKGVERKDAGADPREGYSNTKIEEDQARKLAAMNIKDDSETDSQGSEEESEEEDEEEEKEEEAEEQKDDKTSGMIKVTGIPSKVSEDTLTFFFENRRKSGGGDIEEMDYNKSTGTAVITFKDPEAVDRVLQKMPLLLEGKQIHVEHFVPDNFHDDQVHPDDTQNESKPSCTIEVRGMKETTSNDTIEFYFESKRAAGVRVDIEECKVIDEDGVRVIYITYPCENDMRRVLERNHKVDGTELTVKEYIPPPPPKPRPLYDDKVLIKGLNPDTSKDGLENFLEAKTGILPSDLLYGEEEGVVLVTFEESPDFEKLQEACKKRSLDGNYLHIFRVPISNCVVVVGIGDKTGKDTIEFYFENHRRSGGGDVSEVKINEEDRTCLVYFEDHEVIGEVCRRKHVVDGNTLKVQLYHDMLGEATTAEEGPKFKLPDPVSITTLDSRKVQFLLSSDINKKAVEKQMHSCHTKLHWPKLHTDPVSMECLLTKDVKDSKKLVKTWKKSALDVLDKYMAVLAVQKHQILQDIWPNVMAELNNMNISHPDGVAVAVEKVTFEIYIMGHKQFVDELFKQIQEIVVRVTDEADRKKKQVTEKISVKHHQLLMLSFLHFSDEMGKKYKGMKVKLDLKKKEVTFEGLAADVMSAKVTMYEKTQNIHGSKIPNFTDKRFKFLQNPAVKKHVSQKTKEKNVIGVWEMEGNDLWVYSTSDQDAVTATHILKESVVETPIDVKPESLSLLMSDTWDDKKEDIKKSAQNYIEIVTEANSGKITIFSTDVDAGNVRELVETFLIENTIYEKKQKLSDGIMRYIQDHKLREIEKISKDLKVDQVKIECSNMGIVIKGTELGVNKAQRQIDQLVQKIEKKMHTMRRPGINKLMSSDAGKDKVSKVERDKGVTISSTDDSDDSDDEGTGGQPGQLVQEIALCTTKHFKIHSMLGDITALKVDALVNAANKDLKHVGGLAKAIVEKGGRSIQDECTAHVRRKGKLMEGEVFCSDAGNLPCQIVVHAVGPIWQGGTNQEEEILREAILNSMEETSDKGMTSIAIPALGAGVFGVPARSAVKTIVESVRDSPKEISNNCIKDVYLCDVKQENVDLFTEKLKKVFGADKVVMTSNSAAGKKWTTTQSKRPNFRQASPLARYSGPPGTIRTKVVKGQIAKQRVDVIVNTTSKDLKLSNGAVSNSLLQAAGAGIQNECDTNYPDGVQHGEVAVTQGFNLKCKMVCHGSLPGWDGGAGSLQILQAFMLGCLKEANKRKNSTVAFPAMGTGNLGYPKDIVAKEMFRIVSQYSSKNPKSSVTEVWFVVYEKDLPTIQAFEQVEQQYGFHGEARGAEGMQRGAGVRQSRQFGSNYGTSTDGRDTKKESFYEGMTTRDQLELDVGSLQLKLYQGDITQVDVEAMVNSTNAEFDLSRGEVSKLLKSKGGKELEQQVRLNEKKMKKEGIAVTSMDPAKTGIPCSTVIHLNAEETGTSWKQKIMLALEKAEESSVKSLAFPAIGTAARNENPEDIAVSFIDALLDFEQTKPSDLTEVHMVIFKPEMLQKFTNAMQLYIQDYKGSKHKSKIKQLYDRIMGHGDAETKKPKAGIAWNPRIKQVNINTSLYSMVVYGDDMDTIDSAIQMLESLLDKDFKVKSFKDPIIKEFKSSQQDEVRQLEKKFNIEVKLEVKNGRIMLNGLPDDVSDASDKVHALIRRAEKQKQARQEAELISDMVQWFFIDVTATGQNLEKYPPEINRLLEKAHRDQKDKESFSDNHGNKYIVDLNSYEEYPESNPSDTVKVIRRSLMDDSGMETPSSWSRMTDQDNVTVVQVPQTDQEFVTVQQNFLSTVGNPKTVVKIERIQNRTLYKQYMAKKKLMDAQNPQGHQNERSLWHGTSPDAVDSINTHGFNRSYCGKNAVAYGNGVYFAVNSQYSAQKHYSVPDASGNQKMYQCKVLTGEFTKGSGGMKVPPQKKQGVSHILFDSVVDNPNTPGIFVIFHDTQAYPEYLITFQ